MESYNFKLRIKEMNSSSREAFFVGFCCTRVLVSITGECTLMNDDGDSIHEGNDESVIMVTKTSVAETFFFIIAALEFWKIDKLVTIKGDGCLVVAPKTIQRQANLHKKGMYNNKTKFKSS